MDDLLSPTGISAITALIGVIAGLFEGHRRGSKRKCPDCGGPKCRRRHAKDESRKDPPPTITVTGPPTTAASER